jgi:chromosome segregation ATPase
MITGSDVFGNIQRLRDDCRAYEATGNLSLSMPLYDGGENKNRRRGIASQIRRLTSVERSIMRDHQVTASELVSQLTDLTRASDDNVKQIAALTSRLADITRLQESTQSNFPLLASLSDKLGDLEIQQANVVSELENTRAQIYSLNDQLVDILAVSLEQPQC